MANYYHQWVTPDGVDEAVSMDASPPTRMVVVDVPSVAFSIDQEMQYVIDTTPDVNFGATETSANVMPAIWTQGATTSALKVQGGELRVSATIQAVGGEPADIKRWRAGFLTNLLTSDRTATYENNNTIRDRFAAALPLRVTCEVEFPFAEHPQFPLYHAAHLTYNCNDLNQGPGPTYITELGSQNKAPRATGKLMTTSGTDTYVTWFALARIPGPHWDPAHPIEEERPCIALVNRVAWSVTYTTARGSDGVFNNPPVIVARPVVDLSPLRPVYTPRAASNEWPDLRQYATANDHHYWQLEQAGDTLLQWHDNWLKKKAVAGKPKEAAPIAASDFLPESSFEDSLPSPCG